MYNIIRFLFYIQTLKTYQLHSPSWIYNTSVQKHLVNRKESFSSRKKRHPHYQRIENERIKKWRRRMEERVGGGRRRKRKVEGFYLRTVDNPATCIRPVSFPVGSLDRFWNGIFVAIRGLVAAQGRRKINRTQTTGVTMPRPDNGRAMAARHSVLRLIARVPKVSDKTNITCVIPVNTADGDSSSQVFNINFPCLIASRFFSSLRVLCYCFQIESKDRRYRSVVDYLYYGGTFYIRPFLVDIEYTRRQKFLTLLLLNED